MIFEGLDFEEIWSSVYLWQTEEPITYFWRYLRKLGLHGKHISDCKQRIKWHFSSKTWNDPTVRLVRLFCLPRFGLTWKKWQFKNLIVVRILCRNNICDKHRHRLILWGANDVISRRWDWGLGCWNCCIGAESIGYSRPHNYTSRVKLRNLLQGMDSSFLAACPRGWNPIEVPNSAAAKTCLRFSIFDQKTILL